MPSAKSPTSADWTKIGRQIAGLRREKDLTQRQLSRLIGTSQSAVARMEKGEQNCSTDMLLKIGRALGQDVITLGSKSINFRIEGGHKLHGTATTKTSKNAAVALLCASLLNRGRTTLKAMPRIEEVNRIIEVLTSIGVTVKWLPGDDLEITPPAKLKIAAIDAAAAMKTRSVLMLLGPLMHLFDRFEIPQAGGCKLGARTIRPHLYALEKFGLSIVTKNSEYVATVKQRQAAEVVEYELSDTGTENTLMAAAKMPGVSIIKLASANYQVLDLCYYLEALGVKIEGIGTHTLTVQGVADINLDVTYSPSEDPIESMLFIAIAATTKSALTITRCPIDFLELELLKLEKMGFRYRITRRYKAINGHTNLVDIKTFPSRLVAPEDKLLALPGGTGINIDNLTYFAPIATQAIGQTFIFDWAYDNRAIYFLELNKLGAEIILVDPHRVYIQGPTKLTGAEVICPPALRPAVIILIGMLAATGTSILRNVYSINRGYEDLALRLQQLGAKIEILHEL